MCIDLAKHMTSSEGLGQSATARDAFRAVAPSLGLTEEEADDLNRMVGFRNLAVHDYAKVEEEITSQIIRHKLRLPLRFVSAVDRYRQGKP